MLGRRGLFLDNLYVKPEWRGRGIGHALLSRLAAIAAERKCARLEWMVLNWNLAAIGFYQSEGAALLEGWTKCRLTQKAIQHLCRKQQSGASLPFCDVLEDRPAATTLQVGAE